MLIQNSNYALFITKSNKVNSVLLLRCVFYQHAKKVMSNHDSVVFQASVFYPLLADRQEEMLSN